MSTEMPLQPPPQGESRPPDPGFKPPVMNEFPRTEFTGLPTEDDPRNGSSARTPEPGSNYDPRTPRIGMWQRLLFQRLLIFALVRIVIYLAKLYEDTNAVKEYWNERDLWFCIISACGLVFPSIFYAIFLMGSNLCKDDELDSKEIGTKTVNGLLLIPWQIKRHLDVLYFAAQRVCQWRSPTIMEEDDRKLMTRNAEVLEFFEDLYAGFLQLLLQLYIFQLFNFDPLNNSTPVLVGNIIASTLSIWSMLIAVRRRDDGPLTTVLSFLGWSSVFASRIIVFSLVASAIHVWLLVLCLIHVFSFSIWIYNIAIESYALVPHSHSSTESPAQLSSLSQCTRRRFSIGLMVFLFFGIPSLVLWPIMFQLKEGRRPLIWLLIITVENIGLVGLWFIIFLINSHGQVQGTSQLTDTQTLLIVAVVCFTMSACIFLTGYILCKPKLTDQVVLHEIRSSALAPASSPTGVNVLQVNSWDYGIYYEFCDLVFKLPSTEQIGQRLEEIRRLQEEAAH